MKNTIKLLWNYVSARDWLGALFFFVVLPLGLAIIAEALNIFWIFIIIVVLLGLLIWLIVSFCKAYSFGFEDGYELAKTERPKIVTIKDTWPSHILHASKTIVLLFFVICFFPWFILYRWGKRKGRRICFAQKLEWKEKEAELVLQRHNGSRN
jgi:hypothetical protein